MKGFLAVLLFLLCVFGIFGCERWKFNECKRVGHSTAYCIYKLGD